MTCNHQSVHGIFVRSFKSQTSYQLDQIKYVMKFLWIYGTNQVFQLTNLETRRDRIDIVDSKL